MDNKIVKNNLKMVQKERRTNGVKFEKMIMSKASNDWIVLKSEDVISDLTTTKTWKCDCVNHKQKIFLELQKL